MVRARELSGEQRVRRLAPDDWEIYRRIRLIALATDPHAFGSTFAREQDRPEGEWKTRLITSAFFLGEVNGAAGGLVGAHRRDEYAELISMWVVPELRGKGLAAVLIHAVIDWAAGEGYREVRLWVVEGNVAAEKAYAKAGFVATGQREPHRVQESAMEMEMARATSRPPRTA